MTRLIERSLALDITNGKNPSNAGCERSSSHDIAHDQCLMAKNVANVHCWAGADADAVGTRHSEIVLY